MENHRPDSLTLRKGIEVFQRRWPDAKSSSQESPVFLMAAGWRTGSTLVARMLSRDCLIWGEPYGQGGLLDSLPDLLRRVTGFWPEEPFFFRGQDSQARVGQFIANLYPSPAALLEAYLQFFETLFSRPAKSAGVDRWGVKTVRLSADHAWFFRWLFPRAKFLFLTRNPYHALRSYYTITRRRNVQWFDRWPDRPVTPERFGRHWRRLTQSFLEQAEELGARLVRYEDIMAEGADLAGLESYLEARFAQEALEINPGTFPLPDEQLAGSQYDMLAQLVEPLAESLGYGREMGSGVSNFNFGAPGLAKAAAASPPKLKFETPDPSPPADLDYLFQSGLQAHQQGELDTAARTYLEVLSRHPNHAAAWHFLGVIGMTRGDRPAARQHLERALSLCQTKPVYWNNYGALLLEMGEYRQAEAALHRALDLNRDYADAWTNLGHAQQLLRLAPRQVEQSFRNALKLAPGHVDATFRLADLYQAFGRHGDAIGQYRRGAELAPDHPAAHKGLAHALMSAKHWQEAEQVLQRSLARDPGDLENHLAMGAVQAGLENVDGVREVCRRIVSHGARPPIWKWRHLGVCPTVFAEEEAVERYWSRLKSELGEALAEPMHLDWRTLPRDGFTPSFNLPHHGRCCREVREMFAARFEPAFPQRHFEPRRADRIRVGFLITAGHEGGFLRGMSRIAAGLDPRFDVVVFCAAGATKRFQAAIRRDGVRYVPFPNRFDQAVDLVRTVGCDVLYFWKVGPDPWSYFLPMARLAPVQCTSSGSHGTSGVAAVDCYLSSRLMECADEGVDPCEHYTERLIRFQTFPMFQSRQPSPEGVARAEFDLPEKGALYFCPHRLAKYCPEFDFYLREILQRDEEGQVVLLAGADEHARNALQARMRRNLGEACFRRVRFQPAMPVKEYYRLFRLATVVLDTPVYASSLTAYDAFSVGVPVLTQSGPLAVHNYATGLYRCMGIGDELVARDREDYVAKAVAIGTEPDRREHLVRLLAERDGAVFDDARVISEYERFFSMELFHHT